MMKKPRTDLDEARERLRRELGASRLQRSLERIEAAQIQFDQGLADLSAVLGGGIVWQRGGKVHDQVRAFWGEVARLRDRLAAQGGPAVDDVHVDAELRRRSAAAGGQL